jgi:hypothetical protein
MGVGKTTVLGQAHDLLTKARVPHGAIDLDCLTEMYPSQPNYGNGLMFQSLAAVWPVYREHGAERLIVARVVEDRDELGQYEFAVPGAVVTVCRLTAPVGLMQERLDTREVGTNHDLALARSVELDGILTAAAVEDFTVANDGTRHVSEVARELLARATWP